MANGNEVTSDYKKRLETEFKSMGVPQRRLVARMEIVADGDLSNANRPALSQSRR